MLNRIIILQIINIFEPQIHLFIFSYIKKRFHYTMKQVPKTGADFILYPVKSNVNRMRTNMEDKKIRRNLYRVLRKTGVQKNDIAADHNRF